MKPRCLRLAVLAGLPIASMSLAQQSALPPFTASTGALAQPAVQTAAPSYGTTDLTYVRVTGIDFTPYNGGGWAGTGGNLSRYPTTDISLDAGVHLPGGSVVDYLRFDFCDTNAGSNMNFNLLECGFLGNSCAVAFSFTSSGAPGCTYVDASNLNRVVDNHDNALDLNVLFTATNGTQVLLGAVIGYRLQVSPAPGTATFADVPTTHAFFRFVEALYAAGITGGCDVAPPRYCPDDPVTRGQMAVFLSVLAGLHWVFY